MLTASDLATDQVECIDFIDGGEDSLVAADVGTGKTVIALTSAQQKIGYGHVKRWLALAPTLVCDVWKHEPDEWEHLTLRVVSIQGLPPDRRRAICDDPTIDVVVCNYENLAWLLKEYPKKPKHPDPLPFDGLICDEIDKLKEIGTNRFKAFRNRINRFESRIGLTGTLVPNRLEEVWGQTYMVDGGQTFGRSFTAWRKEHFYPVDFNQHRWAPFQDTEEKIIRELGGLAYRLKATGLPVPLFTSPTELILPGSIRPLYDRLENDLFAILTDKSGKRRYVEAANAAVLVGKLQQICAGFSYVDPQECANCNGVSIFKNDKGDWQCGDCMRLCAKVAVWHTQDKFAWLANTLHKLGNEQVLIFYHFREELDELKRRMPGLHYLGGGATVAAARRAIEAWNDNDPSCQHLALHPASAGHGLNLQKSHARHIALLTSPWSGGMLKQLLGRLCRRGNPNKHVMVHRSYFKNTVDADVINTNENRLDQLEGFLDRLYEESRHVKAA